MSFVYFFQATLHGQEVRLGEKQVFMLEGVEEGQQSRKVAQLDDEYCKLLILLIIPEMKRGHTEHLLVTHLSLSPLIITDGAADCSGTVGSWRSQTQCLQP